jgi:hypothetical protein
MPGKRKRPQVKPDGQVLDAAHNLAAAHGRVKGLRRELRSAEGDVRRSLSLLRKLTTPAARRAAGPRMYRPTANDDVR